MNYKTKILLFCASSFAFIGCDRVTKDLAKVNLINKETVSYFHDVLRLEYVENTGAFLGLGSGLPSSASFALLSILPLIFLMILFVYAIKRSRDFNFWRMISLALIFAGGIGNIIDRLLFEKHVSDFINIGIGDLRTGIFNFADVYVTLGVLSFLLFSRHIKPVLNKP
jgi:signal peptidase II